MCVHIYLYIYKHVYSNTYYATTYSEETGWAARSSRSWSSSFSSFIHYGQFSKFHACFFSLDPGNLKFETVRTNKQHGKTRCIRHSTIGHTTYTLFTLLDVCMSSLRRGRANMICTVSMLTDDARRES